MTSVDGNYEFTVLGAGIVDFGGNAAINDQGVRWSKGAAAPIVVRVQRPAPDLRTTPVIQLEAEFSRPLLAGSFDRQDLTLNRDGVELVLPPSVSITPVSDRVYRIGGLAGPTTPSGVYVLEVDAAGVAADDGTPGVSGLSTEWIVDTTGPRVSAIQEIPTNPRNIVVPSLEVRFSEAISAESFDYRDVTLSRDGGPNLISAEVVVARLGAGQ